MCCVLNLVREPRIDDPACPVQILAGLGRGREAGATLAEDPPVIVFERAVLYQILHPLRCLHPTPHFVLRSAGSSGGPRLYVVSIALFRRKSSGLSLSVQNHPRMCG